jgi:hypothetical protein
VGDAPTEAPMVPNNLGQRPRFKSASEMTKSCEKNGQAAGYSAPPEKTLGGVA